VIRRVLRHPVSEVCNDANALSPRAFFCFAARYAVLIILLFLSTIAAQDTAEVLGSIKEGLGRAGPLPKFQIAID
jgi:hypothetical protein